MEIKITDHTGKQLHADQLSSLEVWNETISHVCASAMERLKQEINTGPSAIEKGQNR